MEMIMRSVLFIMIVQLWVGLIGLRPTQIIAALCLWNSKKLIYANRAITSNLHPNVSVISYS